MDEGSNIGRTVEDMVANLCSESFCPDFVVKGPKYRKKNGQEKEAADVLAVFGETLLVFQVKTRIVQSGKQEDFSEVEVKRFERVIEKAFDQFNAFIEAWRSPDFDSLVNERGLPLMIKRGVPTKLKAFVVHALLKPNGACAEFSIRGAKTCEGGGPLAVHVFSISEIIALLKLANTLPDFLRYLALREDLQGLGLVSEIADPIDLWVLAAFEADRIKKAVDTMTPLQIDGLIHKHHDSVVALEKQEEPSYVIDWLIHELHAGSGRNLKALVHQFGQVSETPGSFEAYQRIVPYLAQLDRGERCQLAKQWLIRVERSSRGTASFGGLKFDSHDEGYLVFSSPEPRETRHSSMGAIALALGHKLGVKLVVCLATGPEGPMAAGCEVMGVTVDSSTPPPDAISDALDYLFGVAKSVSVPRSGTPT